MIRAVSKYRWIFSLRGIVAIVFGLAALLRPPPTLGGMVLLFGLFALLEALLAVVASFGNGEEDGYFSEDMAAISNRGGAEMNPRMQMKYLLGRQFYIFADAVKTPKDDKQILSFMETPDKANGLLSKSFLNGSGNIIKKIANKMAMLESKNGEVEFSQALRIEG